MAATTRQDRDLVPVPLQQYKVVLEPMVVVVVVDLETLHQHRPALEVAV